MTVTPKPAQIRRAIESLGIPADYRAMGLDKMTTERQQSALLALLSAYTSCYLNNHLVAVDPLSPQERYMLNVSSVAEVTESDAASGLNLALYQLIVVRDLIEELGRNTTQGESPKPAISALIHAALELTDMWIRAMASDESFSVGTKKYSVVSSFPVDKALAEIMDAVRALKAFTSAPREAPE